MRSARPIRSKPRRGHDQRVDFARIKFLKPRIDIAADRSTLRSAAVMQQLGAPAQAARGHSCARCQLGERAAVARNQHVARLFARWNGGDAPIPTATRRQILHRMNRQIDFLRSNASSISLVKTPLPPIFAIGRFEKPIAAGFDDRGLDCQ